MTDTHDHHHHNHHSEHEHGHHKPFVYPVRAINNDSPVNLKTIATFNKVDKNDVRNNKKSFSIIFQTSDVMSDSPPIEWRYLDKDLRDLDYKELKDRVSTPII